MCRCAAERAALAQVNGKPFDLERPLEDDCSLEILKFEDKDGEYTFWHSSAHILGQALEMKYGAHLAFGPPTEDGFFYDVSTHGHAVSTEEFASLQKLIDQVVKEKQPFERLVLTKDEALELFQYNPFKQEIISTKVPDGETCTAYKCGPLIDLCRGPHVPHTGRIKAMEVTKNSSSYWQADATKASLQRVYGIAFPDAKALKAYKYKIEEAKKRDHRVVGVQQELFFFDAISPVFRSARTRMRGATGVRSAVVDRFGFAHSLGLVLLPPAWRGDLQQADLADALGVPQARLPGGGLAEYVQQESLGDVRTLAELCGEHVLIRGAVRRGSTRPDLRPSLPMHFVQPLVWTLRLVACCAPACQVCCTACCLAGGAPDLRPQADELPGPLRYVRAQNAVVP